ncbi:hypothetical protein HBH56_069710 [Parastagonospora nodorum]|nr:hypothetical protein HBH56_069710 [Parastagonospora nodorum]KAH3954734.1 hypothetical protein HBH53_015950 [Parastagonospora nodorum]KAH3986463.1 hypothetical protein HBH52_047110 [Parastagonospora nodorum]KAH4040553.1 hypothetical protein HBI09_029460 [Parastagonospora nodorum]KAH4217125.1 hypothetical protein HBI06_217590 [Parastagonospora nodorum]
MISSQRSAHFYSSLDSSRWMSPVRERLHLITDLTTARYSHTTGISCHKLSFPLHSTSFKHHTSDLYCNLLKQLTLQLAGTSFDPTSRRDGRQTRPQPLGPGCGS